jgi:hypothetical protein
MPIFGAYPPNVELVFVQSLVEFGETEWGKGIAPAQTEKVRHGVRDVSKAGVYPKSSRHLQSGVAERMS